MVDLKVKARIWVIGHLHMISRKTAVVADNKDTLFKKTRRFGHRSHGAEMLVPICDVVVLAEKCGALAALAQTLYQDWTPLSDEDSEQEDRWSPSDRIEQRCCLGPVHM